MLGRRSGQAFRISAVLREFIWNDGPFLPPCRKDKEGAGAREREGERAHVCVRTIRRRPPPPHSKSFTIYLGAFIPHFTCERRARRTDAAVEMWEIRSQMRIAAREERFVAARTIKHGSPPQNLAPSKCCSLAEPLQTKKRLTNNTEVVSTTKFLSGRATAAPN